jgi:5-dehydro-2-deoxygluconokinase
VAPYPVEVVCGLGAGDAFGGALCHGLLSGWDLVKCAQAGNAAGAIVVSRLMCADDMPFEEEIIDVLDG